LAGIGKVLTGPEQVQVTPTMEVVTSSEIVTGIGSEDYLELLITPTTDVVNVVVEREVTPTVLDVKSDKIDLVVPTSTPIGVKNEAKVQNIVVTSTPVLVKESSYESQSISKDQNTAAVNTEKNQKVNRTLAEDQAKFVDECKAMGWVVYNSDTAGGFVPVCIAECPESFTCE
jgi:hypothetical protein